VARKLDRLSQSHWRGGVLAVGWRAWREYPLAAALSGRASRLSTRHTLRRTLRRWDVAVTSSRLKRRCKRLADDHFRLTTLGTYLLHWVNGGGGPQARRAHDSTGARVHASSLS
jgi:hypothetical protein